MATQKWCSKRNNFVPCPEHDIKLLTNIKRGYTMHYAPVVWKAELTSEMMFHLTSAQQQELRGRLELAVDSIAAEYKVGREFKHEL